MTSQSHWSLFLPAPHELQQSLYFSIQNHAIVALCITILKSEETEAKEHPANNFTTTVFPLVHNPPSLLPPILLPPQLPALRPYSRSLMGRNPGNSPPLPLSHPPITAYLSLTTMIPGPLAPTSLPTRIPRQQHIRTRSLRCRISFLRSQLLDFRYYDWGYWGEGTEKWEGRGDGG